MELAVDPVADPEERVLRVEMDVGGAGFEGPVEDLRDEVGGGGGLGDLLEFLADIALVLGEVAGDLGQDRDGGRRAWGMEVGGGGGVTGLLGGVQPVDQGVDLVFEHELQEYDRLADVEMVMEREPLDVDELGRRDQAILDQLDAEGLFGGGGESVDREGHGASRRRGRITLDGESNLRRGTARVGRAAKAGETGIRSRLFPNRPGIARW